MMIKRAIDCKIESKLFKKKAIIIIGARQIGKTTSINNVLQDKENLLFLNGDDPVVREMWSNINTQQIKNLIAGKKYIFIDEAQRIPNSGLTAKIIVDIFPEVQLIMSGSSAFDLKNSLSESLTGRKSEYEMFPVTWQELEATYGYLESQQQLEIRLLYGMYPEIITNPGEEKERLKLLTDSYLYKDILSFYNIQKPQVLENLLKALALQMGSEVSLNELANLLKIDKNTVKTYIEILEKSFVVFTLSGFNRNIRNELKQARKIYFWDNGVRNALIGNFSPLELRVDKGALWENFLISERMKKNNYENPYTKSYFWRTTSQQEIDYVEETAGKISAFEIKWNENAKIKANTNFKETYKTTIEILSPKNFRDFLVE
ncbi:ATP-binding protein [Halpernia frigidisoli]|uniref:ATPase n=1 Tax=Halpernia frigidisoli TaxID=1125876 RepID=A0A1I3IME2_9FLAO|nr:ATP-binding protein [Halpernia frigidisoli]SFI49144.1 hypothetical protein SAMN05443292_2696 [Halpernia frigidisoli]